MKDLKITVKEIRGYCDTMQEGDCFTVSGGKLTTEHFCYWALNAILPLLPAKQRKLDEPNEQFELIVIGRENSSSRGGRSSRLKSPNS